jgi:hypothetical protein
VDIGASTGFDLATNADIWCKFDTLSNLKAGGATKKRMEEMEKALGLKHVTGGILEDVELRSHCLPIDNTDYDSMHCFHANGIASQEIHLFLKLCSQHLDITFKHLQQYCESGWKTPKNASIKDAAGVFSEKRESASKDGFKGIASDVIAIFPLINHFVETVVRPRCPDCMKDALASFLILCKIVSTHNRMKRVATAITRQSCDSLKVMLSTHLQLFKRAHGAEQVRPKHHLSQHLAEQIFARKLIIDCWPCERKHKTLKRIATNIDNTSDFERSLLSRVIAEQLQSTPSHSFADGLIGSRMDSLQLAESLGAVSVTMAREVKLGMMRVSNEDIITSITTALQIVACLLVDARLCVLADSYKFLRRFGAGVLWESRAEHVCVTLVQNLFLAPVYWTFQDDGLLLTLADD